MEPQFQAGVSLLFAAGTRPAASDVAQLLASAQGGQAAEISHRPADDHGWLELLSGGMIFDLRGLAPGLSAPVPGVSAVFGLPADIDNFEFEAVLLAPGGHVASGAAMMPVIRALISVAAGLAFELPITAVCWNPAQTWMEPRYFGRVVVNWLSGGPFPVLGLTSVRRRAEGGVESLGLAYFTGQEVHVADRAGDPGSDTTRLATRIIDHLVQRGPLTGPEDLVGPDGEQLVAVPSPDGKRVAVVRGG